MKTLPQLLQAFDKRVREDSLFEASVIAWVGLGGLVVVKLFGG